MEKIKISGLSFSYPGQAEKALDGIDLSVNEGEFLVICGPSGCGKSTLLRHMKTVLTPHGSSTGEIYYDGKKLETLDRRFQSANIGFVQQDAEDQIVTDKVWHELAFAMESLGYENSVIRRRTAETAMFFGIDSWYSRNVSELSGGQKQILNLASVMVLKPELLLLDEPTAQLDPVAASELMDALGRISRELGTTVVLTEHRLEEAFALADRAAVMENGKIICADSPDRIGMILKRNGNGMIDAMPAAVRISSSVEYDRNDGGLIGPARSAVPSDIAGRNSSTDTYKEKYPVSVAEGRLWLEKYVEKNQLKLLAADDSRGDQSEDSGKKEAAVILKDVWFRYDKAEQDILKGFSLTVRRGEFFVLMGGNGAGKTTALKLISGVLEPVRGRLAVSGKTGMLPQNAGAVFLKKTLIEDLRDVCRHQGDIKPGERRSFDIDEAVRLCRLEGLLNRHPFDLSGGERQRAVLAELLLAGPDILLMDEPTRGMDASFKRRFADIIRSLTGRGVTVIMVSHDVEFCAEYADRCAMLFYGSVTAEGTPREFFSGNSFYTTAANRIAGRVIPEAITVDDVTAALGGGGHGPCVEIEIRERTENNKCPEQVRNDECPEIIGGHELREEPAADRSPEAHYGDDPADVPGDVTAEPDRNGDDAETEDAGIDHDPDGTKPVRRPGGDDPEALKKRRFSLKSLIIPAVFILLMPATLLSGNVLWGERKYYFVSLLLIIECMVPFFLAFERKRPKAGEVVILAVLCAVGIAGRAALFMLPQVKPVMAVTVIAGIALSGEAGFLTGSISMLISNMIFSQGPWTPWQMFGMGIAGLIAGKLFSSGIMQKDRVSIAVFGAAAALIIYGLIVNMSSALIWINDPDLKIILGYCVSGFPMDCVHAAATFVFLWFGGIPLIGKLEHVKTKYGLYS